MLEITELNIYILEKIIHEIAPELIDIYNIREDESEQQQVKTGRLHENRILGIMLKYFLEGKKKVTTREVEVEYKKFFKDIARSTISTYLNILKREDCLACGKIEGEENVQIVVPFDANVAYIFQAMDISGHKLDSELWMITSPMTKEIYWNPYMPSLKDPDIKLTALKIKSNDVITLSPLGTALAESEIKKYNVVIAFM